MKTMEVLNLRQALTPISLQGCRNIAVLLKAFFKFVSRKATQSSRVEALYCWRMRSTQSGLKSDSQGHNKKVVEYEPKVHRSPLL